MSKDAFSPIREALKERRRHRLKVYTWVIYGVVLFLCLLAGHLTYQAKLAAEDLEASIDSLVTSLDDFASRVEERARQTNELRKHIEGNHAESRD